MQTPGPNPEIEERLEIQQMPNMFLKILKMNHIIMMEMPYAILCDMMWKIKSFLRPMTVSDVLQGWEYFSNSPEKKMAAYEDSSTFLAGANPRTISEVNEMLLFH